MKNELKHPDGNDLKVDSAEEKETQDTEPDHLDAEGEPQVEGVTLDKAEESEEERPGRSLSEPICEEHTRSMEHEVENIETEESEVAIAVDDQKECREEKYSQLNDITNCMEKKHVVEEPEVESAMLQEAKGCPEGTPDQVNSKEDDTSSMENQLASPDMEEPKVDSVEKKESQDDENDQLDAEGEPQVEGVTRGNAQESEEQESEESFGESACVEHTRSVEHEVVKVKGEESEVAIAVDHQNECQEEKYSFGESACVEHTRSVEHEVVKVKGEESEVAIAVDHQNECQEGKYSQLNDTTNLQNRLEKPDVDEPKVGSVEEKESQEDEPDWLHAGALCEGHATDSVETQMENLHVREPEIAFDKQECAQEKPDHDHVTSVFQEHQTTDSLENAAKKLDVRDPLVGGVTLQNDSECQEDEQPGKGLECEVHAIYSFESEINKLAMVEPEVKAIMLNKEEHREEQLGHAHVSSDYEQHKTTNSLENEMDKPDEGEPLVGVIDKALESKKEKHDGSVSESLCEEHTRSVEQEVEKVEVKEPEVATAVDDEKECQEENNSQLKDTTNCIEKPAVEKPEVEIATLQEETGCPEEMPNQVDRDYICHEDGTLFMENQLEKTDVNDTKVGRVAEKKGKEDESDQSDAGALCEEHATNSAENEMEKIQAGEAAIALDKEACPQEKADHDQATSVYQEHQTTDSLENATEKLDVIDLLVAGVTIQKHFESQEDEQLGKGPLCEGIATNSAEREEEKLEMVEPEVKGTTLDKEECQEENLDEAHVGSVYEEHKTTNSLGNETEKPDEGEQQVGVALEKSQESQEEKPDGSYNESVYEEHTMAMENEMKNAVVGESVDAKECEEENPAQLNGPTNNVEKHPEVEEPKVEGTTLNGENECLEAMPDQVDRGYICKKDDTSSMGNKPEVKKPKVDGIAEKESHEEKHDQLDEGTVCEGHATSSTEAEMENLRGEPEITLDKEDCPQETPDRDHATSVCQEHQTTDSLENAAEKLGTGEPLVGGITPQKNPEYQEDEQLLVESGMEKLEDPEPEVNGIRLDKKECLQEKPNHAQGDSQNQEDKTTDSQANAVKKLDMGEPLLQTATLNKDQESQEDETDQELDTRTICERHATKSMDSEMEKLEVVHEREAGILTFIEEKFHGLETHQAHSGCVGEEHKRRGFLENVDKPDPEVEGVTLDKDQVYEEEKPDHVHSDSVNQDQTKSLEKNGIEELEVGKSDILTVVKKESECQEEDTINSLENGMEQPKVEESEVEDAAFSGTIESCEEMPDHIESGFVVKEHEMPSVENELETPEVGEPEAEIVSLHKNESQEDEFDPLNDNPCKGHAMNSEESEVEKVEVEKPVESSIALEEEEQHHSVGDFACDENQNTDFIEHTIKKDDMEEPHVNVKLDKLQELQEEISNQADSDSVNPASSLESKTEEIEVKESKTAVTCCEEKDYQEEQAHQLNECDGTKSVENEMDKAEVNETRVEIAFMEEKNEHQVATIDQVESDLVSNEDETKSVEAFELGDQELHDALQQKKEYQENEAEPVSGFGNEQLITNSVEEDLEKFEPQVCRALKDKVECQEQEFGQADHVSIYEEHIPVATKVKEVEVGGQEAGVLLDQVKCQEDPGPTHRGLVGEEHKMIVLENELQPSKVDEPEVGNIKLDEKKQSEPANVEDGYQHQTTSSESGKESLEVEGPEAENATLGKVECREEPCEEHTSNALKNEAAGADRSVKLSDNSEQIDIWEQHTMISEEHEMEKLDAGEAQEEYHQEEDCQTHYSAQLSSSGSEEHATNTAERETEKLEVEDAEVESVPINKQESQEENTDNSHSGSVCEESTTRPVENMEKLNTGDSEVQSDGLDKNKTVETENPDLLERASLCVEQTADSLENDTQKPELSVAETEGIMMDEQEECKSEKTQQIKGRSECEKHATDSEEHQEDKLEQSHTELEGMEARQESKECQEEIINETNDESTSETERPEVGVAIEVNKEGQGGKPHQVNDSRSVSLQSANSVENDIKKNELGVPEVEDDVLDNQCQIEQPYQAENSSVCEEHATHTNEDSISKSKVSQPEVEGVALDEKKECQGERTDINNDLVREKDAQKEKQEVQNLEVCVALEENEDSQEGKPDQVTDCRPVSEVHTAASLTNVTQQNEVTNLEKEDNSLDENQGGGSEQIQRCSVGEMCAENTVENELGKLVMDPLRTDGLALDEKEECPEENPEQVGTKPMQGEQTIYSMQNPEVEKSPNEMHKEGESVDKFGQTDRNLDLDTVEIDLQCEEITPVNKELPSDETHSRPQPEVHSSFDTNEQSDDFPSDEIHSQLQSVHSDLKTAVMPPTGDNKETEMQHFEKANNIDIEDFTLSEPPEDLQTENNDEKPWKEEQQMNLASMLHTQSQSFESAKQQDSIHDVQVMDVLIAHYREGSNNMKLEQIFEKADQLDCSNLTESQEAALSTPNDYQETKEEHKAQPVDALIALSSENKAHGSGLLHVAQDATQTSIHDFTTDEEGKEVDCTDVPAESKREDQATGNSTQIACEELLASVAQETEQASEEQELEQKDVLAESKRETRELETRDEFQEDADEVARIQTAAENKKVMDMPLSKQIELVQFFEQLAPKHQEDADEVAHIQKAAENKKVTDMPVSKQIELVQFFERLNTAKHDKPKQELIPLDSWKKNQTVDLIAEPALNQETQKSESDKVNDTMPLDNIPTDHLQHIQNHKTDGQQVQAEGIKTHQDEQAGVEIVTNI